MPRRVLGLTILLVLGTGMVAAAALGGGGHGTALPARTGATATTPFVPATDPPTTTAAPPPPTTTTEPPPTGPVALAGCPVPPSPPGPPGPGPGHPAVLVPEAALPAPAPPAAWTGNLDPIAAKGMWVWQFERTEGGDADVIVAKAAAAGLHQLWVRVADSRHGFYGAATLAAIVPRAHRLGIAVMAWGFPYLYDPVNDAKWSAEVMGWHGAAGDTVDGFSPDLETGAEGVAVSERRVAVYLDQIRRAAGSRLVVATVFRPTDRLWATYPYRAVAPYVDAFAAMVYWGCTEPGDATTQALQRLGSLRPVHVIGQGYNMAEDGGRRVAPNRAETVRFLDVASRGGAVGASFWVWQEIGADQWDAMATFGWRGHG